MTWWAQRSALPRTRRVGRCRGGCAGGRCCTCRSGIRTAFPDARIAVDKWHLVALANLMVTQVRQRMGPPWPLRGASQPPRPRHPRT
ncbi:transposase [Janibacter indicus]